MPERGSSLPPRVGNDVVDLAHPACRVRGPEDRLLDRILAPDERAWLEGGPQDARGPRLWALWAAKETAFKVAGKGPDPLPFFRPSTLACELTAEVEGGAESDPSPRIRFVGSVRGPGADDLVRVEGRTNGAYLHVVGWSPPEARLPGRRLEVGVERIAAEEEGNRSFDRLRDQFTEAEWAGVHSLPSARVRLLVRERLARFLDAPDRIEILTSAERPGRTPPRIRVAGEERDDLDLSLSHHGRYLAWALLLPPTG